METRQAKRMLEKSGKLFETIDKFAEYLNGLTLQIHINAFPFDVALKLSGTKSPSFKYLEPVGVNSKQHLSRAKYLHNKNKSPMDTCPTSSSSPSFTDKPPSLY